MNNGPADETALRALMRSFLGLSPVMIRLAFRPDLPEIGDKSHSARRKSMLCRYGAGRF